MKAKSILAALILALVAGLPSPAQAPGWAVAVLPSGAEFGLEVAVSDEERALGYMFRESVGPREGMLFLFEESGVHSFWMKNCKVSLDIIWLDAEFRVVHIAHDTPPCPPVGDCPHVLPMRTSRYVLEFAAGTAREQGLATGDRIVVLSDPPL